MMRERKYGLDDNTIHFIGHALALHSDDRYLVEPALNTVKRMKVSLLGYYALVIYSQSWVLFYLFTCLLLFENNFASIL